MRPLFFGRFVAVYLLYIAFQRSNRMQTCWHAVQQNHTQNAVAFALFICFRCASFPVVLDFCCWMLSPVVTSQSTKRMLLVLDGIAAEDSYRFLIETIELASEWHVVDEWQRTDEDGRCDVPFASSRSLHLEDRVRFQSSLTFSMRFDVALSRVSQTD